MLREAITIFALLPLNEEELEGAFSPRKEEYIQRQVLKIAHQTTDLCPMP